MLSMWRALVVPLLSLSFAGQAGTIGVSNDNQLEKQEIHPSVGDTYDNEIANSIAQEVLKKTTKQGWLLNSSVTDCYNQARQPTKEINILYCIALDILSYKLNHGFTIKYAEIQSVIERADATLSALGRRNETAFAVTHAMRISNRVRDKLESQPEPPAATPPEAAVPPSPPSATASAPPAGNAPPPSPTTTASNPPEALAPPETPAPWATAPASPAVNAPPRSPTTTVPAPPAVNAPPPSPTATASIPPKAPAPPKAPPPSATASAPPAANAPPQSPRVTASNVLKATAPPKAPPPSATALAPRAAKAPPSPTTTVSNPPAAASASKAVRVSSAHHAAARYREQKSPHPYTVGSARVAGWREARPQNRTPLTARRHPDRCPFWYACGSTPPDLTPMFLTNSNAFGIQGSAGATSRGSGGPGGGGAGGVGSAGSTSSAGGAAGSSSGATGGAASTGSMGSMGH